jgi:hypothetical protein
MRSERTRSLPGRVKPTLAVASLCLLLAGGDNKHLNNSDGGVDSPPMVDAMPDGPPSTDVLCETLTAGANTCDITAGTSTKLFKGNVLTPGKLFIRRPGLRRCDRADHVRRLQLRDRRRDHDHLRRRVDLAGPDQHARPHHVHSELALHRYR